MSFPGGIVLPYSSLILPEGICLKSRNHLDCRRQWGRHLSLEIDHVSLPGGGFDNLLARVRARRAETSRGIQIRSCFMANGTPRTFLSDRSPLGSRIRAQRLRERQSRSPSGSLQYHLPKSQVLRSLFIDSDKRFSNNGIGQSIFNCH